MKTFYYFTYKALRAVSRTSYLVFHKSHNLAYKAYDKSGKRVKRKPLTKIYKMLK
jgi:hypothetical protein